MRIDDQDIVVENLDGIDKISRFLVAKLGRAALNRMSGDSLDLSHHSRRLPKNLSIQCPGQWGAV